jgi:hypothetical protein
MPNHRRRRRSAQLSRCRQDLAALSPNRVGMEARPEGADVNDALTTIPNPMTGFNTCLT